MIKLRNYKISPALIVVDVQNGFVSKGGSYHMLGMALFFLRVTVEEVAAVVTRHHNNEIVPAENGI
jgi:nicotinamidase-related amidase